MKAYTFSKIENVVNNRRIVDDISIDSIYKYKLRIKIRNKRHDFMQYHDNIDELLKINFTEYAKCDTIITEKYLSYFFILDMQQKMDTYFEANPLN